MRIDELYTSVRTYYPMLVEKGDKYYHLLDIKKHEKKYEVTLRPLGRDLVNNEYVFKKEKILLVNPDYNLQEFFDDELDELYLKKREDFDKKHNIFNKHKLKFDNEFYSMCDIAESLDCQIKKTKTEEYVLYKEIEENVGKTD